MRLFLLPNLQKLPLFKSSYKKQLSTKYTKITNKTNTIKTQNQKHFYRDKQDKQDKTSKNRLLGLNQKLLVLFLILSALILFISVK